MLAVARAAHIGAEKRCWRALLLGVPRRAMAGEIGLCDFLFVSLLQVLEKARPASLNSLLGLAAIQQVHARRNVRIAVGMCINDIGGHVARAGQYGLQELMRNM